MHYFLPVPLLIRCMKAGCRSPIPEGLSFSPPTIRSISHQNSNSLHTLPWFKFSVVATKWLRSQPEIPRALATAEVRHPLTISKGFCRAFLPTLNEAASHPYRDFFDGSDLPRLMVTVFGASNHISDVSLLSGSLVSRNQFSVSHVDSFRLVNSPTF